MTNLSRVWNGIGTAWNWWLDFLAPVVTSVRNELNDADHRTIMMRALTSTLTLALATKGLSASVLADHAMKNADVQSTIVSIFVGVMGGIVSYSATKRQRQKQGDVTTVAAVVAPTTVEELKEVVKETAAKEVPDD